MSQQLSFPRLMRIMQNDLLRVARPVAYGTLAIFGVTVLVYLNSFSPTESTTPLANEVLLAVFLLGGGVLFTSVCFTDMHHPLERYQYLMMPCSNLERFVSRYLLTGPLFILYAIVATAIIDWVGNLLTDYWLHTTEPMFSPFTQDSLLFIRFYLVAHIVALTGAICFRSYALIRTVLSLLLLLAGMLLVLYVGMRIFYWDDFSFIRFHPERSLHMQLMPLFASSWMNVAVATGFSLWLLYVAYRCLRAHEVQDGI